MNNFKTSHEPNGSLSSSLAFDLAMQQAMLDMGAEFNLIDFE
jgi:hypothetical protein